MFIPWALDFFLIDSSLEILSNAGYEKEMVISLLKEGRYDGDWENIVGSFRLKSLFAYNTSSVGASGAIMGLLAAFGLNFPNAKLAFDLFSCTYRKIFYSYLLNLDLQGLVVELLF